MRKKMYKDLLEKRLSRKRTELKELENTMSIGSPTPEEKRKYIELKAVIRELENVLDMADVMLENSEHSTVS